MDHDLKNKVKSHYGAAAKKVSSTAKAKASCGCGPGCCSSLEDNEHLYTKEYLDSLPEDAVRASLGCANPIFLANLQKGEVVLDLGSGGGIDALISTKLVGPEGMVYGLDMTDEMLELANRNKEKMGVANVAFLKGYIEEIPLGDESVDVITSNCVINLCEDKEIAMKEAYRVLKKGGRLAIADIVQQREVPEDIKKSTEMWLGCIAGALDAGTYRTVLEKAGFSDIEIEAVNPYLDGAYAGSHIKAVK